MRKTIRRGVLLTATAACALGFGVLQASAATVPTLPNITQLPTDALTAQALTEMVEALPADAVNIQSNTLPSMPGQQRAELPLSAGTLTGTGGIGQLGTLTGLTGLGTPTALLPDPSSLADVGTLANLGSLGDLLGGTGNVAQAKDIAPDGLPATLPTGLPAQLPTGLPTSLSTGLPGELPAGKLAEQLPMQATSGKILATTPTVLATAGDGELPVQAEIDHNLEESLVPTDSDVVLYGMPMPKMPTVTGTVDALKLPESGPITTSTITVPRELPVVGDVTHDVTAQVPAALPSNGLTGASLPTDLTALPVG